MNLIWINWYFEFTNTELTWFYSVLICKQYIEYELPWKLLFHCLWPYVNVIFKLQWFFILAN
jgi:hypothetical protein